VRITALPDFRSKLAKQGIETIGNSPAEFAAAASAETRSWAKVINDAGAKLRDWLFTLFTLAKCLFVALSLRRVLLGATVGLEGGAEQSRRDLPSMVRYVSNLLQRDFIGALSFPASTSLS
jgi:hypothetical protein